MKNLYLVLLSLLINVGVANQLKAEEIKSWKTKDLYCNVEIRTFLMDKNSSEDPDQSFSVPEEESKETYVKMPLKLLENSSSAYGKLVLEIKPLNALIETEGIFRNFDRIDASKPSDVKELYLSSRLVVNEKVLGAGSSTKEAKHTESVLSNNMKIHTIEDEEITRYRFRDPKVRMSYYDAAKAVYPNKDKIITGATVSCTAFSWQ